jgi:tetratricopeptide (TPR) repeat protein
MSPSTSVAPAKYIDGPVSTNSRKFPLFQQALPCLLLAAAVLVSYGAVTRNGFLNYDDDSYIVNNRHVKAGLNWNTVKWAFTTFEQANWAPMSWLSHTLDYSFFGLNAAGHHYVSVLLHAANAVLLFLLLQRATGFRWRSLMVAALFALHPVNVESVAWAAERKNVLSMLFFLLALHAYILYVRKPGVLRYAVLFFTFALGLLSKSQVITFPFLLLLLDYWPLVRIAALPRGTPMVGVGNVSEVSKKIASLLLEKVPLLLLSAASALITMKAQRFGGAIHDSSQYSMLLRLENALISYARYLGKAIWPSKLAGLYPHPAALYPVGQVMAAAMLLAAITVVVLRVRDRRYLAVGWFWFLGSLVPMIGFVQVGVHAMADRFAYIPFIGLFLMFTWLAADWTKARRMPTTWLAVPAGSCLLVLGILTYRQVGYWRDAPTFWTHAIAVTENNYVAHDMLGAFLATEGNPEEAAAHFRAALEINPKDLPAELNLGTYEHGRGNLAAAVGRYQIVTQYSADAGTRAMAYGNMGSAYRQMGNLPKAKLCYETALRWAPDQDMAMIGLGLIAQKNGDAAEAVRQYSHAMSLQPTDVGFLLLAGALQQEGRTAEAKGISDRVARLSPDFTAARAAAGKLVGEK